MQILIKAILISGLAGFFCTTKVSEWVLLNNIPEDYLLVYHTGEEINENTKTFNRNLFSKISSANIKFREVKGNGVREPYYALYHENRIVRKYSDAEDLADLPSSPAREKIAREIMTGKLCVILCLKTGNPGKDARAVEVIKSALDSSDFAGIISYVELSRNNVEERNFVSMLLNVEEDLKELNEPMVFGIFGRFRALEPLVAGGISRENIGFMISFLTADCSCLIKDDLPGVDILFTNKWENPTPALVNRILDENPSLIHK